MQHRQEVLVKILGEEPVYSQEELIEKLRLRGIDTTQATLSRDLRSLRVTKRPGEGYRLPEARPRPAAEGSEDVIGIDISGPVAVLHTKPGYAMTAATLIDQRSLYPVLGTVAGYDTVLIIIRQGQSSEFLLEALASVFPSLSGRLF